jgi:hypothetical protein
MGLGGRLIPGVLLLAPIVAAATGRTTEAPDAQAVVPTTQPAARADRLTYRLADGSQNWDPAIRARIVAAMDEAVALYNAHGTFNKVVTANYNPRTRTADANYDGWINFGGQINARVALHEIGHTLGIGTTLQWRRGLSDGKWTGEHGLAQLRAFDGPDAILKADRMHFWPYGLNYDREWSDDAAVRHVKLVAALRKDMGIENGQPPRTPPAPVQPATSPTTEPKP